MQLCQRLAQTTCLALGLQKGKDVSVTHWSLDVTDDGAGVVIEELNANLGDVTTGSGPAQDLHNTCVARLILSIHKDVSDGNVRLWRIRKRRGAHAKASQHKTMNRCMHLVLQHKGIKQSVAESQRPKTQTRCSLARLTILLA